MDQSRFEKDFGTEAIKQNWKWIILWLEEHPGRCRGG